ncbi:polyprotein [Gossypium australe]|uniref:Polyprotein n=1 Tax=Gossypium australe TaxID=47621 RepID=A0A5B6X474_9ROSI|nr:polyprotein [Gossypium australe]
MVLPLKGCNVVLGVQWLLSLGSINLNFSSMTMQFTFIGTPCIIKVPEELQLLLNKFQDILQSISSLPPARLQDHRIPFKYEGAVVKVRPYRYPMIQKSKLEKLVREMLKAGIISDSSNPFASLMAMLEHLSHLREVFELLRQHQLFFEKSKCSFGTNQVEYLGHIISKGTVSTDKTKVDSVATWPIPSSIKELRGFLGILGYYRRFIRNYGVIARPFTNLLKKEAWGYFYVDTDASGCGVGEVLYQQVSDMSKMQVRNSSTTKPFTTPPNPRRAWSSIFMDFTEGLPNSGGKNVIFVVVDRLTKYAHFIALAHPFTTAIVVREFMDNVYILHGMPDSIISDRDKVFVSTFWQDLFKRCMIGERPQDWQKWLPLSQWWYNTTFHSTIQVTPYEAYGKTPPLHMPYLARASLVATVDR